MRLFRFLSFAAIAIVISITCYAAGARTVQLVSFDGNVEVKQSGQTSWIPATMGMMIAEGDTVKTAPLSRALLSIDDGKVATVEVKEGSEMLISELKQGPEADRSKTLLDLAMGEVLIKAQKISSEDSKFEVKTPTSLVGVRGTTFSVKVDTI